VLVSGTFSLTQHGNYNFQRLHTPSIKQAASHLAACEDGAVVFADGPQIAVELMYHLAECPVYFFNETLEMTGGFAMISGSEYRVADTSELPEADTILHVFYNEPKNKIPDTFSRKSVVTHEKVSVAVYQAR